MKTLKWFSLEWRKPEKVFPLYAFQDTEFYYSIRLQYAPNLTHCEELFETEQQAFDWLEANKYIERTEQDENKNDKNL